MVLLSPMLFESRRVYSPALLNANHVFLAHPGSYIIVLMRSLRKAKEAVKLCANIASFAYGFRKRKDLLRQFVDDFQFSIFFYHFWLLAPLFILKTYR